MDRLTFTAQCDAKLKLVRTEYGLRLLTRDHRRVASSFKLEDRLPLFDNAADDGTNSAAQSTAQGAPGTRQN